MSGPDPAEPARYGLMTEAEIKRRVEKYFGDLDSAVLELVFLYAKIPRRMKYILMKLELKARDSFEDQLRTLRAYGDEKGIEKLVRRLRYEEWKAIQEDTGANTTQGDIFRALEELEDSTGTQVSEDNK